MKRIYLSPPHTRETERALLLEAFDSNWIAPRGPHIEAFENEICGYVGVRAACALSSGTAALHLGLQLLGVQRGDLVFCSTLTFVASINPARYLGASPVFIDSEPTTGNLCPRALERAFVAAEKAGKKPLAVIAVDLYGQSASYSEILEICARYETPLVEDAAEALGSTWLGRKCGSFGKFAILSFNGNKILTTSGGGMLLSDDQELIARATFLSQQASLSPRYYEHEEMGYNYRMSNLLAAVGRGQLSWLDERVQRRQKLFDRYRRELSALPGISFFADPEPVQGRGNRWLTVLLMDPAISGLTPLEVCEKMQSFNIECRLAWKPMHRQPLYAGTPYFSFQEHRSYSDEVFARGLCLPSSSSLSDDEQSRVIESFVSIYAKKGRRPLLDPVSVEC